MKRFLIPFLLLLSQCGNPVDFKRDNPLDPLSDAYLPNAPTNLSLLSSENNHFMIAWQADSVFDSILIERKTPLDSDFVRLAAVDKNVKQYVDSTDFTSHPISYRVGSLYRRNRKAVISYSRTLKISQELAWGNIAWNGIPNAVNIRHFSEYDDLYVMDDGVYDYNTRLKLFTVPPQGTDKPNGFTNKGGYVAQIGATSSSTTLRHYTSDGNHSGDINIPGTRYMVGQHDDIIYLNPLRKTVERYHLLSGATTDVESNLPVTQIARFASSSNDIVVYIENQLRFYNYSETEGYTFVKSFDIPAQSSEFNELRLTDSHAIIRSKNGTTSYLRYIDRDNGSIELFNRSPSTGNYFMGLMNGYEWMMYFGQDVYFINFKSGVQSRIFFDPLTTSMGPQKLHRIRAGSTQPEVLILRASTSSSQLVKLKKQNAWVVE